jgi:hypothetical protein
VAPLAHWSALVDSARLRNSLATSRLYCAPPLIRFPYNCPLSSPIPDRSKHHIHLCLAFGRWSMVDGVGHVDPELIDSAGDCPFIICHLHASVWTGTGEALRCCDSRSKHALACACTLRAAPFLLSGGALGFQLSGRARRAQPGW